MQCSVQAASGLLIWRGHLCPRTSCGAIIVTSLRDFCVRLLAGCVSPYFSPRPACPEPSGSRPLGEIYYCDLCAHLRNLREIHSKQVFSQITQIFADTGLRQIQRKVPIADLNQFL